MQAIHGFKETEWPTEKWQKHNAAVFKRVTQTAFSNPGSGKPLPYQHVLDLAGGGYIKPHVDSQRVRYIYVHTYMWMAGVQHGSDLTIGTYINIQSRHAMKHWYSLTFRDLTGNREYEPLKSWLTELAHF